jgi:glycosyltransferase involved in cell wall biosynthesis
VIEDGVNGLLVDHNDVEALAEAALKMVTLGDAARDAMGHEARQTILGSYTWDKVAHRLLSIYREA